MAKGRYYTPGQIKPHVGVWRVEMLDWDRYVGTGDSLIEAGVVILAMLPGQTGMPSASVCFRPAGSEQNDGCSFQPGFLQIRRKANGQFLVEIRPSKEERTRRLASAKKAEPKRPPVTLHREAEMRAIERKVMAEVSLSYDSPEKFRDLLRVGRLISLMASSSRYMYRLADCDLKKLRDLEDQMQRVIDVATVVERLGIRQVKEAELAAATCAPYQAMMCRIESANGFDPLESQ